MMLRPLVGPQGFRAQVVQQEKVNLKNLIASTLNDRFEYAHERMIQEMCKDEPYGTYEHGRIEDVDGISSVDLMNLHQELMREAPIDMLGAGDFDPDRMASVIGRLFYVKGRRATALPSCIQPRRDGTPREVVDHLPVDQSKLLIGARTYTTLGDPEYFSLLMFNGLLGAFPHSRLFSQVREKEGLAYAASSSLDASKGLLVITCGILAESYEKTVGVIRKQLGELAAGRFTDDELEKARAAFVDRFQRWDDDPSARMGALAEMLMHGVAYDTSSAIERIRAVRRDQIAAVAQRVKLDTIYFLTRR
jgi:predicted Zn-dependent peptidase